jgi:hypothetical protein
MYTKILTWEEQVIIRNRAKQLYESRNGEEYTLETLVDKLFNEWTSDDRSPLYWLAQDYADKITDEYMHDLFRVRREFFASMRNAMTYIVNELGYFLK